MTGHRDPAMLDYYDEPMESEKIEAAQRLDERLRMLRYPSLNLRWRPPEFEAEPLRDRFAFSFTRSSWRSRVRIPHGSAKNQVRKRTAAWSSLSSAQPCQPPSNAHATATSRSSPVCIRGPLR